MTDTNEPTNEIEEWVTPPLPNEPTNEIVAGAEPEAEVEDEISLEDFFSDTLQLAAAKQRKQNSRGKPISTEDEKIIFRGDWQTRSQAAHHCHMTCDCGNQWMDFRGFYFYQERTGLAGAFLRRLSQADTTLEHLPLNNYLTSEEVGSCYECLQGTLQGDVDETTPGVDLFEQLGEQCLLVEEEEDSEEPAPPTLPID